MATKLTKPVTRALETSLQAKGLRAGFVARLSREGVYLKPPKGRWSLAYFASWGDVLLTGAVRKANEAKKLRAERRAQRRS